MECFSIIDIPFFLLCSFLLCEISSLRSQCLCVKSISAKRFPLGLRVVGRQYLSIHRIVQLVSNFARLSIMSF